MSTGQHSPDDLRERLRSLGYLNAPVDRFVLGGAANRRSAAALAGSASLRIGLLAGLLLGPAGAIGLAAQLPELITNVTDAIVMAAYLVVTFGVAAGVAAFIVIMPAGLIAQSLVTSASFAANARRVAAVAGALIFFACLAYLTLWWRAAVTTTSAPTPLFSAAVLGVAVAISLVLGHVVMVTALAFIARIDPEDALRPGVPLSSWNITLPLAGLAFAGAAALLFAAAPSATTGPVAPPLTVVPTGQRVLVIAIDGVDTAVLDRMRDAHALPALSQLLARGDSEVWSDSNRDPARVWTTIATGQSPERHGITALEGRQLTGVDGRLRATSRFGTLVTGATDLIRLTRPTIASGSERRIPTFWEVAARTGLRTSVINWWATWPAVESGEDTGTVLSDRALLRLEQGGSLDSEIAPAALYATLERSWPERRSRAQSRAQAAMAAGTSDDIARIVSRSATIDAEIADLASDAALANVDLQVVYLPGLDIAQHGLFATETGATATPSAMAARVTAIETYYRFLDGLVADLTGAPRTVILVTQPGRVSNPG
ncbi:MAG: alkaline phosphatase family protein, partial [Acidobacteriota bacterium]